MIESFMKIESADRVITKLSLIRTSSQLLSVTHWDSVIFDATFANLFDFLFCFYQSLSFSQKINLKNIFYKNHDYSDFKITSQKYKYKS